MIVRLAALALALAGLGAGARSAGADGPSCPTTNPPNELILAGGAGQTAQLGKPFETPLQAQLANTNGCPVTGNLAAYVVDFAAPADGASATFPSTGSREAAVGANAQGIATAPSLLANHVAGSYAVHASSSLGSVDFSLTNTATGVPAQLAASGATAHAAGVNAQYAQPLRARVLDAAGNPIAGVTVSFSVAPGPTGAAATFLGGGPGTATTDADGVASSPALVANGIAGAFTAAAAVDGVAATVVYRLDNHATAARIAATRRRATARVGAVYARPLRATVRDAQGRPIEGATVTFAIVATSTAGAGATFMGGTPQATATTNAAGTAVSPRLTANTVAGSFSVVATTPSAPTAARFSLTNRAGVPATVAAGAASGESTTVRTRFPVRLAVTVTDAYDNAVPHAVVVFTAPKRGASGHFAHRGRRAHVTTKANGVAVAPPFVAGRKAGGYAVVAIVKGTRVAFALVNEPRT